MIVSKCILWEFDQYMKFHNADIIKTLLIKESYLQNDPGGSCYKLVLMMILPANLTLNVLQNTIQWVMVMVQLEQLDKYIYRYWPFCFLHVTKTYFDCHYHIM